MSIHSIKIIPLLVFVVMLSFSVRLVDVVTGVSSLSGSAYAKSEKDAGHTESTADEKHSGGLVFSDDEAKEKKPAAHDSVGDDDDDDVDSPIWRDPMDEDPGYTSTRMEVFDELSKRRKGIESREKGLTTREALLKAGEQEIDRKYQELSQLRKKIEKLLKEQSNEEESRIKSLVKIYEGMKPKDAARIFNTLDLDILISVLSGMSERKLSPVLAAMNPERARTVTIMLAEQKQLPTLPYVN